MKQKILSIIAASIQTKQAILEDVEMIEKIETIVDLITAAYKNGNKVLFCGNGGSAADAQHLAAEFTGRFYKNRIALQAEALHVNTSYITAVANDYGFDVVYERLVEGIGNKGDVLIALSTSGNSINILKAVDMAIKKEMITIGFTGKTGGAMNNACSILVNVPSADTPRIQESHILIGHIICQLVEQKYFDDAG